MNILPNQEELYMNPHAHVLLILMHHVLVYLERCVDEAPFGFVAKKSQSVSWIDIPHDIDERYVDYLNRIVQTANSGVYGVWMEIKSEKGAKDVVVLTMFVRQKIPFCVVVPVTEPHRWWVARDL